MTIHRDFVWEVRTTGDDTNGGGYKSSAGTTDYSQQDAAQLSLTDCATSGASVTTLTSATGGFTAAMVGSLINLSAGTNLTVGFYEITAFTDTNTVTLDRSPDDGVGGLSGATGKVGGALKSPSVVTTPCVNGNKIWVKSGTYAITVASAGVANGLVNFPTHRGVTLEGYQTVRGDRKEKPLFLAGGSITGVTIVSMNATSTSTGLINIKVDGNSQASVNGISSADARNTTQFCEAVNCVTGFAGSADKYSCYANNCATGFINAATYYCFAENSTGYGFNVGVGQANNCIARNCTGGYYCTTGGNTQNCVADGCATGWQTGWNSHVNAIAINCTTYSFNGTVHTSWFDCCEWNCAGDDFDNPYNTNNFRVLTSDPFEDSANSNYQLNNIAGGGRELRDFIGVPTQVQTSDAGAVQRQQGVRRILPVYAHQADSGPCRVQKFTIGSGANRDFAECSDFTAAFDNTLVPQNWTTVVVEFHNDTGTDEAVFETPFYVTPPSNCDNFIVTVADDSWHKGDPTKGCVLKCVAGSTGARMSIGGSRAKKVERLRFDSDGLFTSQGAGIIGQPTSVNTSDPGMQWYDQLIVTGGSSTNPARFMHGINAGTRPMTVTNCLVYNIVCGGTATSASSYGIGGDDKMNIIGCTVDNIDFTNTTGSNVGIQQATTGYFVQNNIVTNVDVCYSISATSENNVDDDGTGTDTSSSATEFVDAANGDYTLNSGATAAGLVSTVRFGPDVSGKLRYQSTAGDAGAYNTIGGHNQSEDGGGASYSLHPLAYN